LWYNFLDKKSHVSQLSDRVAAVLSVRQNA